MRLSTLTFPRLHLQLRDLERKESFPACIAICRSALRKLPPSDWNNRYEFGRKLAKYLINHMPNISSADGNAAIGALRSVLSAAPTREKQKRARCALFLGYLFHHREEGIRSANLRKARRYYALARRVLPRDQSDKAWADQAWAIATCALAELDVALEPNKRGLNSAIRLTQQALGIYTRSRFPEDHKIYSEALASLKRHKRGRCPDRKAGRMGHGKGVKKGVSRAYCIFLFSASSHR
jgi:hypothetical protein